MNKKIKRLATTTIVCVIVASIFGSVMVLAPPELVFPQLIDVLVTNTSTDPVPVDVTDSTLDVTLDEPIEVSNPSGESLDVEVTNPSPMPIATNTLSCWLSGGNSGTDLWFDAHYHPTSPSLTFENKTIVLTGGSLIGGLMFSSNNGIGTVPAVGMVKATTTIMAEYQLALPFNSLIRIENVTKIELFVRVDNPDLPGPSSYYYLVWANVFWFIEE